MKFNIVIKNCDDEKLTKILHDYWKMDSKNKFIHTPQEIMDKYKFTRSQLKSILTEYSQTSISLKNCFNCGVKREYIAYSQAKFKSISRIGKRTELCNPCTIKSFRKVKTAQTKLESKSIKITLFPINGSSKFETKFKLSEDFTIRKDKFYRMEGLILENRTIDIKISLLDT
jgi:hypothetical protein